MLSAEEGLVITTYRRQGSCGEVLRPILSRIHLIVLYQLWGDRRKPYNVFLRGQYSLSWKYGSPMGGLITVTSSSVRVRFRTRS